MEKEVNPDAIVFFSGSKLAALNFALNFALHQQTGVKDQMGFKKYIFSVPTRAIIIIIILLFVILCWLSKKNAESSLVSI